MKTQTRYAKELIKRALYVNRAGKPNPELIMAPGSEELARLTEQAELNGEKAINDLDRQTLTLKDTVTAKRNMITDYLRIYPVPFNDICSSERIVRQCEEDLQVLAKLRAELTSTE